MNTYLKDQTVRYRNKYNVNEQVIDQFNNSPVADKVMTVSDIIESSNYSTFIEYEDVNLKRSKELFSKEIIAETKSDNLILNMFNAHNLMLDNLFKPLNLKHILDIHEKIMNGFGKVSPGKVRDTEVYIGDGYNIRTFVKAVDLNYELIRFIKNFNSLNQAQDNYNLLKEIMWIKKEFIRIHPFKDGNGRTSRLLLQKLLLENYLPVSTYSNWIREDYHDIMELSVETGRINILTDFYLSNITKEEK